MGEPEFDDPMEDALDLLTDTWLARHEVLADRTGPTVTAAGGEGAE